MKAIANAYWRSIKRGMRAFGSVPENLKEDVRRLAREDVAAGVMTAEEYAEIIGEPYEEAAYDH
jgi:hypothetical protein